MISPSDMFHRCDSWSHLTDLKQTLKGIGYSVQLRCYVVVFGAGYGGFFVVHAYANTPAYMKLYVLQRYSQQVSLSSS